MNSNHTTQQAGDIVVLAAIEAEPVEGTLERRAEGWSLTMSRRLATTPDRLWDKLTRPEQIALWGPHAPDRPLTSVGPATAREHPSDEPVDATVLEVDPPRTLVHRWGSGTVRWTVAVDGDDCILTLEHLFAGRDDAPKYGAGWHICLAVLTVLSQGQDVDRVVGSKADAYGWSELHDRYAEAFGS